MKCILLAFLFYFSTLAAHSLEFISEIPLHDGFVTQERGGELLKAVPLIPPVNLVEKIPEERPKHVMWLKGYWDWSEKRSDFIWVSGCWRRPPPDHVWIEPKWVNSSVGWVRLKGFWSPKNLDQLTYLTHPSPDALDEPVTLPPSESYYWIGGCWEFDPKINNYVWQSGQWQAFSPLWQFVPPHYVWRERGYVYIPGFWDFPIESRGMLYANIFVKPEAREKAQVTPKVFIDPLLVAELLFSHWPDYPCFFQYHFHKHAEAWLAWSDTPVWWKWKQWWGFMWQDAWWLWWWWTHPGYAPPPFLPSSSLVLLPPPDATLIKEMQSIQPPVHVTDGGVVGTHTLIHAIQAVRGDALPILPADIKLLRRIQQVASPKVQGASAVRPQGVENARQPVNPWSGQSMQKRQSSDMVIIPPYPSITNKEQTQKQSEHPKVVKKTKESTPPTYRTPQPRYPVTEEELKQAEQQRPGEGPFVTPTPIRIYKTSTTFLRPSPRLEVISDSSGTSNTTRDTNPKFPRPSSEYVQGVPHPEILPHQMLSEDLDHFMIHPMPQKNPYTPRVDPRPNLPFHGTEN